MQQKKYYDIKILSQDMDYIDKLSISLDIDYNNCPIDEWFNGTNSLIQYMAEEKINSLDISEESKIKLQESIYTNCLDSRIDTCAEYFPEEEQEIIQDFIDCF